MKKMNRREFLTLTGAAVVALSLAGCGGPSAPPAPPAAPTGKEAELLAAINRVWKKKYEEKAVVHEQLTFNQDAVGTIRAYGRTFENANETPHKLNDSDNKIIFEELNGLEDKILEKYGEGSLAGMAGVSEPSSEREVALEDEYSCENTAVQAFVDKLLNSNSNSSKAEYISLYLPVVKNVTYMTAIAFLNNKP